jgi:hypothetical protein
MEETLQFAMNLNTCGWNAYPAIALPGSQLYKDSLNNSFQLPENYEQFGFVSRKTLPMYSPNLTRQQILEFRDQAFIRYHSNEKFLDKIEQKFGQFAKQNILKSLEIKIEREYSS